MSATQVNMERETMFKWKKMALEQENQVELLKSFVKHHQECIEISRAREHILEEKLQIAKDFNEIWKAKCIDLEGQLNIAMGVVGMATVTPCDLLRKYAREAQAKIGAK